MVQDFKNKYENEINKHKRWSISVLVKDVDEASRNKIELEYHLEGLIDNINFLRQPYEKKIQRCTSAVLPMNSSTPWRWTESSQGLHSVQGHSEDLLISEMNFNVSHLQAETEAFKGQRIYLEAAIADAEQSRELVIKDANAKLAELEATL
ncbi:Keratin, type II cytoskeletal 8 [Sciurus carolinensis]|uniref:Keratin, type II cytoskeletal 8 n=1 Tax=Sciurus carolinensis TaxID=30640 RepID=A0AA41MHI1_SCICA|nr:Keratin, type II cytoskeletal 8 [Sciurus carolinensis]